VETYVTAKGQIVIPLKLRRKYGIKAGTRINIIDTGDGILLQPVSEITLLRLQGQLKGSGVLKLLIEERQRDVNQE
jgi:AbrB family looped-hinge helix DNA binding protein